MAAATRGGFPAGVVLHADRGTQVTSQKLAAYMRAVKGTVSMGQAGVCWDNAIAESLWATFTTEYYYRRAFTTRDQVYTGVTTWIEDFYNRRRIHTSLGGKSPHRIRTTPSGLDNSRFNKPSTTCAQAHHRRGRTTDPLYKARRMLHTRSCLLTPRQQHQLLNLFASEEHVALEVTWSVYQNIIDAYRDPNKIRGKALIQAEIAALQS